MNLLSTIACIVLVAILSAGAVAVVSAVAWMRMVENFDRKVDREVNRRLRNTKVVYKFNVRTDFVDDTPEKYAQMQEM